MLDIGAGTGLLSLYAACNGAERVVALEPEAAGSRKDMRAVFHATADELGCTQAEMLPLTFQEYEPAGQQFDVVMVHQAINHLDEEACIRLHRDPAARATYRRLLAKLAGMCSDGAKLIIVDVSRHNLFSQLGLRCPFAKTIEWHKHQPPKVWSRLLSDAGFQTRRVRWFAFNRLGLPGRALLGNAVGAYVLGTNFCLVAEKV
jgi:cyclopropane fatty-acyl-phospholipid synthase-like methyltransferase